MKFDLMYYLGMDRNSIMRLDLAELQYYYAKLREVRAQELEIEKLKIEANLIGAGAKATQQAFTG